MRLVENNIMLIYDVIELKMFKKIPINPNSKSLQYLYIDDEGFSPFKMCRSSDI